MDPPQTNQPTGPAISDRVLIDGTVTPLTLTADGRLLCSTQGQRSLSIEKEVLGFAEEGSRIRIKAVVDGEDGSCCVSGRGNLVRKDFVFEPLSDDSRMLWCVKLRECVDSLGNVRLARVSF